jgi:serine/threonine-protein kinase
MAGDPADRLVGEIVDERWKLVEPLGAGGMGVVYRAERVKLGKLVAIKFLDERAAASKPAVARFDREARAISRLHHRHCVSILDFGVWRGRPYIVMEYVAGRPLNKEMGKTAMTPERSVRIMKQILEALRHAHAMGVVHRDLKPENVMLTESTGESDYVKLLDFGLARIISVDEPSISMPKMVAGTPSYMSPEQARGEKVDHRTDIYSAGVILYGMVTGKKPFSAPEMIDVLRMHMNVRPPSPRKVAPERRISVELERVILKALEKDRDARFYHAEAFLAALEAVPEARAASQNQRRRGRFVAAAALLLLAGGGAAAWRWQARSLSLRTMQTTSSAATASANGAVTPATATAPAATATAAAATATAPAATTATPAATAAEAAPTGPATTLAAGGAPKAAGPAAVAEAAVDMAGAAAATAAPPTTMAAAAPSPTAAATPATAPAAAPTAPAASPTAPSASPTASAASPTAPRASSTVPALSATPLPSEVETASHRVTALLDADRLGDAERLLLAEQILEPRAGWVHLQLGEIYFRRLWRRDAEKEWDTALRLDPSLRSDARLGQRLCTALGPSWNGAGQRLIVRHVGADAVAPLTACIRGATDLGRLQTAARLIERVAGRGKLDRDLVAARTAELSRRR